MVGNPFGESLVLTANERLQRHHLRQLHRAGNGNFGAEEAPNVYSIDSWMREVWLVLQDNGYKGCDCQLIDDQQEKLLWTQLLESPAFAKRAQGFGVELAEIVNPQALAKNLMEARRLIQQWQLPLDQIANFESAETTFLLAAIAELEALCSTNGWLLKEAAIACIDSAYHHRFLAKPRAVKLLGFTEISPLWQKLLGHFSSTLGHLTENQSTDFGLGIELSQYETFEKEIDAAADWCERLLPSLPPNATIAVVVPNLASTRQIIEQRFNRCFDPEYISNAHIDTPRVPYDISASPRLLDEPVIRAVFDLLSLQTNQPSLEDISVINLCVYWGQGLSETRLRAAEALSQHAGITFSKALYLSTLEDAERTVEIEVEADETPEAKRSRTSDFYCFQQFIQALRHAREKKTPTEWRQFTIETLELLRWPGPRTINSREYQAIESFRQVLALIESLEPMLVQASDSKVMSFSAWVTLLKNLAGDSVFHVQVPPRPIQILGILEAAGSTFDHCRIIGLTENNYPTAPEPNPLIPYALQKQFSTPRATPERELGYAQNLLHKLCNDNPAAQLSYFSVNEVDEAQKYSPLLASLVANKRITTAHQVKIDIDSRIDQAVAFEQVLEKVDTTYGPPLEKGSVVRGGSDRLQLHNANPFFAFAVYDLGVKGEQSRYLGIPPFIKGSLIHGVLGVFWKTYVDSEAVRLLSESEIDTFIINEIHRQLQKLMARHNLHSYADALSLYESETLVVIKQAIAIDLERAPFTVTATEKSMRIDVGGYVYQTRLDRLDAVQTHESAQANSMVIDYKSGSTSLAGLQKSPLPSPQLPLYAHGLQQDTYLTGVAYMEVNNKTIAYSGIANGAIELQGLTKPELLKRYDLPSDWDAVIAWWSTDLSASTTEIAEGYVANVSRNPAGLLFWEYLAPAAPDVMELDNTGDAK